MTTRSHSISWGPAVTASSLPASETNGLNSLPNQSRSGFTKNSKDSLIATSTVGGTLILFFLFYALWRRRHSATVSGLVRFRSDADTIVLTPMAVSRNDRDKEWSIHQELRYSVRWSNYRSTWGLFKTLQRPADIPSPVAKASPRNQPYVQHNWNSMSARQPTKLKEAVSAFETGPDPIQPPETARLKKSKRRRLSWLIRGLPSEVTKEEVVVAPREAVSGEVQAGTSVDIRNRQRDMQDRWSWTNSQAPATPQMCVSGLHFPHSPPSSPKLSRFHSAVFSAQTQEERLPNDNRSL